MRTSGNDYIDQKEFHYFVQYLHHYLQLWSWFCEAVVEMGLQGLGLLWFE